MMKYVGFIIEHDSNIIEGTLFKEMLDKTSLDTGLVQKIIEYLNKGIFIFGWMGYFSDLETNKVIAPDNYFTDGEWIWPGYFPYYLEKYNSLKIDQAFINYLLSNQFNNNFFKDSIDISYIEDELIKKLNGNI